MFEGSDWGDDDGGWDLPVPSLDVPELTERDYLAEVERQLADDPDLRPEPTPAEVIARGECEPVSPGLVGQLWSIDPQSLSEDLAVGYAVAWDRVANAAHARRGLGVARLVTVSDGDALVPREQHATGQLAPALGVGLGAAAALVADTMTLVEKLPATSAAALTGTLSWRKASAVA